jgi:hypothetical protein
MAALSKRTFTCPTWLTRAASEYLGEEIALFGALHVALRVACILGKALQVLQRAMIVTHNTRGLNELLIRCLQMSEKMQHGSISGQVRGKTRCIDERGRGRSPRVGEIQVDSAIC